MMYVTGPGHGGPALVAQAYLEGTYSEVYSNIGQDEAGMQQLFKQFSFPGGIPSHVAPETPGSIHEGGELGYALSHAYGAAFDNPDLIVACVVGDGEAETGPLATSWHSNKLLNPVGDGVVLPIRRLVNADSTAIPTAPDGTTFNAATHTHYLARAGGSVAASDVVSTVDTVAEHYASGQLRVYIPRGLEATFRTFTSNFRAFTSPMLEIRSTTDQPVNGGRLNMLSPNDREIGLWDDKAIVSVKPWMPANYVLVWMDGSRPPLVMRVPSTGRGGGALFMEDEHRHHPLTAQFFGRYFGFGVWERTAAAVLYTNNTTYAAPTLP
jgi:hypothetical protein